MATQNLLELIPSLMTEIMHVKASNRSYAKVTLTEEQYAEYEKLYKKEQIAILTLYKELHPIFENIHIPEEGSF